MARNLWGDIEEITTRTHYSILKEQASILERITKGLLIAKIVRSTDPLHAKMKTETGTLMRSFPYSFSFLIIAPALND